MVCVDFVEVIKMEKLIDRMMARLGYFRANKVEYVDFRGGEGVLIYRSAIAFESEEQHKLWSKRVKSQPVPEWAKVVKALWHLHSICKKSEDFEALNTLDSYSNRKERTEYGNKT